ncbi:efflux RND transporter periplasmic adaptor subunit [Vibrio gallicus]|uniref:efflux RND transporter periplasmic adaptor subunit n=1 Tax=Vibrio gallicus TaxID=190897 RepID=UPI0021C35C43|nr:efflux RND transporter periplasmic adaptor subunit [Vibrio gallicus]
MFLPHKFTLPVCVLLASMLLQGCNESEVHTRPAQGPLHVDVLNITPTTLRLSTELPGRIVPLKQAEVRPQVTGVLQSRLYKEGAQVSAGETLYKIDPTVYQSNVNSAQAQLAKALTNEQTKHKTVARYKKLLKSKLTSQQVFDDADAAYREAVSEVAIRKAALNYANIQLSYTDIKAPIAGQAGISLVSEGSLLTAGQASYLTSIVQTDNVYVDMKQSSLAINSIKKEFASIANKDSVIPVSITLEDGSAYDQVGHLEFSDIQVSDSTGTVTLRAIIPNPNKILLSGMYVRAHISMPAARDYIVLPQSAIVRSQSGAPWVFTVSSDNKVVKKAVVLGNEYGNGWIVKQGLNNGDHVVISNLINMKSDLAVVVDSQTPSSTQVSTTAK